MSGFLRIWEANFNFWSSADNAFMGEVGLAALIEAVTATWAFSVANLRSRIDGFRDHAVAPRLYALPHPNQVFKSDS